MTKKIIDIDLEFDNVEFDETDIKHVTRISKMSQTKKGSKGPKHSIETKKKIAENVAKQWENIDQSARTDNVSKGVSTRWKDPKYREQQEITRSLNGQYTDPVKAANFKSPIVGTCIKTGVETVYLGAKELKDSGVEPGNVYNCINGKRKSTGGKTWRRI